MTNQHSAWMKETMELLQALDAKKARVLEERDKYLLEIEALSEKIK